MHVERKFLFSSTIHEKGPGLLPLSPTGYTTKMRDHGCVDKGKGGLLFLYSRSSPWSEDDTQAQKEEKKGKVVLSRKKYVPPCQENN